MPNLADHELLHVHEVLLEATLSAKELKAHQQAVRDPELQKLVHKSLQQKQQLVEQLRQIIG